MPICDLNFKNVKKNIRYDIAVSISGEWSVDVSVYANILHGHSQSNGPQTCLLYFMSTF